MQEHYSGFPKERKMNWSLIQRVMSQAPSRWLTLATSQRGKRWNYRHIVHYDKIVKFNAVNLEFGFRQLVILSPREVSTYEEN